MNNKLEVQLFVDTGNGFNEEQSLIIPYIDGQTRYEFDISRFCDKILNFRLDPLNASCVICIEKFYLIDRNDKIYNLTFQFSNADIFEKMMYFVSDDPQIFFSFDNHQKAINNFNRVLFEINFYFVNK